MLDYGQPTQSELGTITAAEAARHLADRQFPPGSMGPKIEAALRFLDGGGELAAITSPDLLAATLTGGAAIGHAHRAQPAHAKRGWWSSREPDAGVPRYLPGFAAPAQRHPGDGRRQRGDLGQRPRWPPRPPSRT